MMTATVEFVRYFTAYDGITYMAHCMILQKPNNLQMLQLLL